MGELKKAYMEASEDDMGDTHAGLSRQARLILHLPPPREPNEPDDPEMWEIDPDYEAEQTHNNYEVPEEPTRDPWKQ